MAEQFMQHYKIYLTPLSPIHIGCGEDFEPTNRVIHQDSLYLFEYNELLVTRPVYQKIRDLVRRERLEDVVEKVAILIQNDSQEFVDFSHYQVSCRKYLSSKSIIERHSYLPYQYQPYIPSSGIKGAIAMALLDNDFNSDEYKKTTYWGKNQKEFNDICSKLAAKLMKVSLGGKEKGFVDAKLRIFKPSDFIPTGVVESEILCVNALKKNNKNDKKIRSYCEYILAGQYRSFSSEFSLFNGVSDKNINGIPFIPKIDIKNYFKIINKFYYERVFKPEISMLKEQGQIDSKYIERLEMLLNALQPAMLEGRVALMKIGKGGGAESKSYRHKDAAKIRIHEGDYRDTTSMYRAVGNINALENLMPIGWVLLELDGGDLEVLRSWCSEKPIVSTRKKWLKGLAERKDKRRQVQQEKLEKEKALLIKRQQAEQEVHEKEQMKKSLNENQLMVIALVEKFESGRELQIDSNSPLLKEVNGLIANALAEWSIDDKRFVSEQLTVDLLKTRIDFKKKDGEKNIRKALNKLVNTP